MLSFKTMKDKLSNLTRSCKQTKRILEEEEILRDSYTTCKIKRKKSTRKQKYLNIALFLDYFSFLQAAWWTLFLLPKSAVGQWTTLLITGKRFWLQASEAVSWTATLDHLPLALYHAMLLWLLLLYIWKLGNSTEKKKKNWCCFLREYWQHILHC